MNLDDYIVRIDLLYKFHKTLVTTKQRIYFSAMLMDDTEERDKLLKFYHYVFFGRLLTESNRKRSLYMIRKRLKKFVNSQ